MRNVFAIFKRELQAYFGSLTAYIVLGGFFLIVSFMFINLVPWFSNQCLRFQSHPGYANQLNVNRYVVRPLLTNMSILLLMIAPVLTMRLIAEERSRGTLEMLMTRPVSAGQIVAGKYLAALAVLTLLLLFSSVYMVLLDRYSNPDWGPVLTGYLGLYLMGAAFLAIGLCTSSFTDSQLIAAVTAFIASLSFWIIGWPETVRAVGAFGPVLEHLSLLSHYEVFSKGILDSASLVYYLSFVVFGLYLSRWALASQRWR